MRKVRIGVKKRERMRKEKEGKKETTKRREERKKQRRAKKEEKKKEEAIKSNEERVGQKEENNKGNETHLLRPLQGCRIVTPSIPCERTCIVVRMYISINLRNGDAVVGIMKMLKIEMIYKSKIMIINCYNDDIIVLHV